MVNNVDLGKLQHQTMSTQGTRPADQHSGYINALGVAKDEWGKHNARQMNYSIQDANAAHAEEKALNTSVRDGLRTQLEASVDSEGVDSDEVQNLRTKLHKLNAFMRAGGNVAEHDLKVKDAIQKAQRRAPWLKAELGAMAKGASRGSQIAATQAEATKLRQAFAMKEQQDLASAGLDINDPLAKMKLDKVNRNKHDAENLAAQKKLSAGDISEVTRNVIAGHTNSMTSMMDAARDKYGSIANMPPAAKVELKEQLESYTRGLGTRTKGSVAKVMGPRSELVDYDLVQKQTEVAMLEGQRMIDSLDGTTDAKIYSNQRSVAESQVLMNLALNDPDAFKQATAIQEYSKLFEATPEGQNTMEKVAEKVFSANSAVQAGDEMENLYIETGKAVDVQTATREQKLAVQTVSKGFLNILESKESDDVIQGSTDMFDAMSSSMAVNPKKYKLPAYDSAVATFASPKFLANSARLKDSDLRESGPVVVDTYVVKELAPKINELLEKHPDVKVSATNKGLVFSRKAKSTEGMSLVEKQRYLRAEEAVNLANTRYGKRSRVALRATENFMSMSGKGLDLSGKDAYSKKLFNKVTGIQAPEQEKGFFDYFNFR